MNVGVADESVVVSKARPMKVSNVVEDKLKPTINSAFDRESDIFEYIAYKDKHQKQLCCTGEK